MTQVILTGATGFIGRHAIDALLAQGHEVHAVARAAGEPRDGVTWHELDLLQPDAAQQLADAVRAERLLHLAWYAEHGRFWTSPENVRWVEASLALLRAFADAGGRRAVMAGTCAEYEWSQALYDEASPLRPATLYGAAKHGLHVVASAFAEQQGLELAWGRVFFLYGPFEAPGRFVPSIVRPLLASEPAQMTEGSQRRDFLHSADAGAAFVALLARDVTGAVNIASGDGVSLREVAQEVASQMGAVGLLQVGARPMPDGDPPSLVADTGRLRDEVGWRPRIALADGLREVIEWWRERLAAEPRHG